MVACEHCAAIAFSPHKNTVSSLGYSDCNEMIATSARCIFERKRGIRGISRIDYYYDCVGIGFTDVDSKLL